MSGVLIGGAIAGCLYAMVALGLMLIHRTSGALNLAQGATASAGAFVVVALAGHGWALTLGATAVGVLAGAGMNLAVYLLCVLPLERRGADPAASLVGTLGAMLVIVGALEMAVGFQPRSLKLFQGLPSVGIAGVAVPPTAICVAASALAAFSALWFVLHRTRVGLVLRMSATDLDLTAMSGVSVTVTRAIMWAVAGALSTWGVILFSAYQTLSTGTATALLLASAVAASWGAFRSIPLTLSGAIVLGVVVSLVQRYVTVTVSSSVSLLLLLAVFLLRQRRMRPADQPDHGVAPQPRPALRKHRRLAGAEIAVLLIAGLTFWWNGGPYQGYLVQELAATLIAAVGVGVTLRYSHRLNLGTGGFMLLGAYSFAIAARSLPVPVAVLIALAVPAAAGLLLGALTAGLGDIYYAVVTLVFTTAIAEILAWASSLTGGPAGTSVPAILGMRISGISLTAPFAVSIAAVAAGLYYATGLSRLGARALLTAADRSVARATGLSPVRYFMGTQALSAVAFGLAGALLAAGTGYVEPTQWGLSYTLMLAAAVIIGGGWTVSGAMIAAAIVVLVPTVLGGMQNLAQPVFGAVLVVFVILAPGGLETLPARAVELARRKARRQPVPVAATPVSESVHG